MVAGVMFPALAGITPEVLPCVQGPNPRRRVVFLIEFKSPLNNFEELLQHFLVFSLVKQGVDIVEL